MSTKKIVVGVTGASGALAGFLFVGWTMLGGIVGALVAVAVATIVAAAAFVGWTTLGRTLERTKDTAK